MHDGPFQAHGVQSQPYVYPDSMELDPKTPSCAQCKDKNYTRTYCRTSKKHKTLPWSTVYVMLSMRSDGPPSNGHSDDGQMTKKRRKMNNGDDAKEDPSDTKDGELKRKEPGQGEDVKTEDLALPSEPEDIFQDLHESRTFLSTVSLHKNDAKWVDLDQNAVNLMQHRAKAQESVPEAQDGAGYPPHSPYGQMMPPPNGNYPMGMNMHPGMGHFPGMQGHGGMPGMPNGGKEDPNRPPMENPWGMNGGPFPQDLMYNAAQMMDPRMGGYGFQPGWHGGGRGYPMDMQGMQGGPPPQMGQMPYEGHMMQQQQMWGGQHGGGGAGGGQMPPPDMGNMGQMMHPGMSPHGMPPHQAMMQGMHPHGMPPQGMSPQLPPSQGMSPQPASRQHPAMPQSISPHGPGQPNESPIGHMAKHENVGNISEGGVAEGAHGVTEPDYSQVLGENVDALKDSADV
jgi:hypothetical protein